MVPSRSRQVRPPVRPRYLLLPTVGSAAVLALARALPTALDTGSAEESAADQRLRAVLDCNAIGHGVRPACTVSRSTRRSIRSRRRSVSLAVGEPEDIANVVTFLFVPERYVITGTAFRVDGGKTRAL